MGGNDQALRRNPFNECAVIRAALRPRPSPQGHLNHPQSGRLFVGLVIFDGLVDQKTINDKKNDKQQPKTDPLAVIDGGRDGFIFPLAHDSILKKIGASATPR